MLTKKTIIYSFFLFLLFPVLLFADDGKNKNQIKYAENVHQYLVRQAYELLKFEYPEIVNSPMNAHIGNIENGGPFTTSLVVAGAYREDIEDIIYGYGRIFDGWTPTATHFWNADAGDDSKIYLFPRYIENAYQKARVLIYGSDAWGNRRIFIGQSGYWPQFIDPPQTYTAAWYMSYNSLLSLYKLGEYYWEGFDDITGVAHYAHNGPFYMSSISGRDLYVWELLGHVAHLLGDMSVPAHVHSDPHASGDTYDDAVTVSYASQWNYLNAFNKGGIIKVQDKYDPLRYLFYTVNQVADHFPSQFSGDNSYNSNFSSDTYLELKSVIEGLGNPPNSVNVYEIGNTCVPTAIRAIAGLLHWFAWNTNMIGPKTTGGTLQKNEVWGNVNLTDDIYVPVSCSLQIVEGSRINLNGHKIISTGGTINVSSHIIIDGTYLKNGSTITGIYPSIQSACEIATSGQTVELQRRTYNENFSLNGKSNITISGYGATINGTINLNNNSYCNLYGVYLPTGKVFINGGIGIIVIGVRS